MKTHLVILACLLSLSGNLPAQTITVVSPDLVTVDGKAAGGVVNFAASNPQFAAQVQAGLDAWMTAQVAALAEAQAAQQRAENKLKLLVDGAKSALTKPTSAERLAAGNALLSAVQATQTDEEKAALLKQQAEITAKLQALEGAP